MQRFSSFDYLSTFTLSAGSQLNDPLPSFCSMEGAALSEPVWVTEIMRGGPAQSTGNIMLWDELLAVDGHAVIGQTLEYIVNLIWYLFQFTFSFVILFTPFSWCYKYLFILLLHLAATQNSDVLEYNPFCTLPLPTVGHVLHVKWPALFRSGTVGTTVAVRFKRGMQEFVVSATRKYGSLHTAVDFKMVLASPINLSSQFCLFISIQPKLTVLYTTVLCSLILLVISLLCSFLWQGACWRWMDHIEKAAAQPIHPTLLLSHVHTCCDVLSCFSSHSEPHMT